MKNIYYKICMYLILIEAKIITMIPHPTIIVDTETTGTSPYSDELIQVSLVSGAGRVLFDHYIKPENITEWRDAQKVNHISPLKVFFSLPIWVYAPLLNAYFSKTRTVVGYNVKKFDIPFLEESGVSVYGQEYDVILEDASRRGDGRRNARWRKLTKTALNYGFIFPAHNSLEDCFATLHIYSIMKIGLNTVVYWGWKLISIILLSIGIGYSIDYALANITQINEFLSSLSFPVSTSLMSILFVFIAFLSYAYGPITGSLASLGGYAFYHYYFLGNIVGITEIIPIAVAGICMGIAFLGSKSFLNAIIHIVLNIFVVFAGAYLFSMLLNGNTIIQSIDFKNIELLKSILEFGFLSLAFVPFYKILRRVIRRIV